jgi:sporulation protein YlmC with PRC-barrel domain
MMRTTKLALSVGSVLALTLTCLAQNDQIKPGQPDKPQSQQPPSATKPAQPGQPQIQQGDVLPRDYSFMGIKARDLIGKPIVNAQGKTVGDVNDILIDMPHGRIAGVIVGVGGVLGVGEKPRIVPPQAFRWQVPDNKLTLAMDEQLRTTKTRADDLRSYNELTQVYRDFQQEPYWTKGTTRQPVRELESRDTQFRVRKAKELLGANIDNSATNKKLGDIEELILDLPAGRVALVAVGAGGVLGVGEKLVAVPPSQLQMNPDGKLVMNTTEERLKSAPQFDKSHWPDINDANWLTRVYSHYGEPSYWSREEGTRQPVRERDTDKKP